MATVMGVQSIEIRDRVRWSETVVTFASRTRLQALTPAQGRPSLSVTDLIRDG
jgi:hypothetical protein